MVDEDKKTVEAVEEPKESVSIVDEARKIRDDIVKQKEELKTENDRRDKLNAEEMLSGSAGGHVEAKKPKEESDVDYSNRILEGKADAPTE